MSSFVKTCECGLTMHPSAVVPHRWFCECGQTRDVPCHHAGCQSHITNPCDGCGRTWGEQPPAEQEGEQGC